MYIGNTTQSQTKESKPEVLERGYRRGGPVITIEAGEGVESGDVDGRRRS